MSATLSANHERALLRAQGIWVIAATVTSVGLASAHLWERSPHIAVAVTLAAGAVLAAQPGRLWTPLAFAAIVAVAWLADALGTNAVLGAGAACGVVVARSSGLPLRRLDVVNSALAGAAGGGFAWFAAQQLLPGAVGTWAAAALVGALLGLGGALAHIPPALAYSDLDLPSSRAIQRELGAHFREAPLRALALFAAIRARNPEHATLVGLAEVTRWVFELQLTAQTLQHEASAIDVASVERRLTAKPLSADAFLREREQATAAHLRRLLQHRVDLEVERQRVGAVVDFAIAYLEEARVNLTLAAHLPAEASPAHLDEVLNRLRSQAVGGSARRATAREVGA